MNIIVNIAEIIGGIVLYLFFLSIEPEATLQWTAMIIIGGIIGGLLLG